MDEMLLRLHQVELEILCEVDKFCKKNNIPYSLYCGTMLGAIRHKGFIPWDDDIDICMMRSDYNRFINLWEESSNTNYIIQNKKTTPKFTQTFTKIRKNNTTFLQEIENNIDKDYHTGIFIDILPLDRIPNNRFAKIIYTWNLMNYLLFTKEFVPKKEHGVVKYVSMILLKMTTSKQREKLRVKYLQKITKYNKNKTLSVVSANSLDGLKHVMPSTIADKYKEVEFENHTFNCYEDTEGVLTAWYDNYMELPPKEQQTWRHKPKYISFDMNYSNCENNI